jgi:hypothetical protein
VEPENPPVLSAIDTSRTTDACPFPRCAVPRSEHRGSLYGRWEAFTPPESTYPCFVVDHDPDADKYPLNREAMRERARKELEARKAARAAASP